MKTNEQKARILNLVNLPTCVAAYAWYCLQNISGNSHPNISSWTIWSLILILNFTSYKKTTGDWTKSLFATANSILTILTTLVFLIFGNGTFRDLSTIELVCVSTGIIAGLGWWHYKSSDFAQTFVNIAILIGFIPSLVGVVSEPENEVVAFWLLLTITNIVQCRVVRLTWSGRLIEFLNPVTQLILNCTMAVLALR